MYHSRVTTTEVGKSPEASNCVPTKSQIGPSSSPKDAQPPAADRAQLAQSQSSQQPTQSQGSEPLEWDSTDSQNTIPWGELIPLKIGLSYIALTKKFSAGRGKDCVLVFPEKDMKQALQISKTHFIIEKLDYSDGKCPVYIKDCSSNGTFRNGIKIGRGDKHLLLNKDKISVVNPGHEIFVFQNKLSIHIEGIPNTIKNNYFFVDNIGGGAFGKVYSVINSTNFQEYAMKHISTCTVMADQAYVQEYKRIENEVNIMRALKHPCVVEIKEFDHDIKHFCIVMELMHGGSLYQRIIKNEKLTEKISKCMFYQICLGVQYLHEKKISHRDLKPENILLCDETDYTLVKLSDFGLSKFINNSALKTSCGTPMYMAPEILKSDTEEYTKLVDVWSLGIILYACLSGKLPFPIENVKKHILEGKVSFKNRVWHGVGAEAIDLIRSCLTVNPKLRPDINKVLRHQWLQGTSMTAIIDANMNQKASKHDVNNQRNVLEEVPQNETKRIRFA